MHIRYPDLDRPHPLGPQPLAVLPHLAAVGGAARFLGAVLREGSLRLASASMTASALVTCHGNGGRGRAASAGIRLQAEIDGTKGRRSGDRKNPQAAPGQAHGWISGEPATCQPDSGRHCSGTPALGSSRSLSPSDRASAQSASPRARWRRCRGGEPPGNAAVPAVGAAAVRGARPQR